MARQRNLLFGDLLTKAIFYIKAIKNKDIHTIEDDLGEALAPPLTRHSIQKIRQGYVPAYAYVIQIVRYCIQHGKMDSQWAREFLSQGGVPERERYLQELFPKPSLEPLATAVAHPALTERAVGGLPGSRCRKFYGYRTLIEEVISVLQDPQGAHIVLSKSFGGYGKTELAGRIAVWLVEREKVFEDAVWMNLKQWEYEYTLGKIQTISQALEPTFRNVIDWLKYRLMCHSDEELKRLLRQQRILIVVDNLESLPETEREALLNALHNLLGNGPSRAIFTSRYKVIAPYPYQPKIPGLEREITRALLIEEANHRLSPVSELANASDRQIEAIWKMTGGMPLALHLVVGQCEQYELERVIANLREARAKGPDEDFYTYLFRQAWLELGTEARGLLAFIGTTSRAPQTRLQLKGVTLKEGLTLDEGTLDRALAELSRWYLVERVEMQRAHKKIAYDLHPLTRFFVGSAEIRAHWGAEFKEQNLYQEATHRDRNILDAVLGEVEW